MEPPSVEPPLATHVLIPFAGGLLAGGLHHPGAFGALLAAALALLVLRATRARARRARRSAFAAGLACGALLAVWCDRPLPDDHVAGLAGSGVVAVDGVVVRSDGADGRVALVLDVTQARLHGATRVARGLLGVTIAHAARAWPIGTHVHLVGTLRHPRNFANPGGYDHEGALARRGIRVTLFLWNDAAVEPLPALDATASVLVQVRGTLAARIASRTTEPVRGYLSAVLLGATQSLDDETRTALTRTGLAHVVSVSGFHVAVAAGACFIAFRWLLLRFATLVLHADVAKVAAALSLLPVGAYAAIAGDSIPAARSFLTYPIVLGALASDRPPDGLRALALAAIVLATPVPDMAADVSFELSFVSVAALILAGRRARGAAPTTANCWWQRWIVAPMRTSVAATVATAPLTAWHFQQVSLIAPVANLITLPLLGPATLLPGLAALPLATLWPAFADRLLDVAAAAAALGLAITAWLGALPWAAVMTPMPSLEELALAYAALGCWWTARYASHPPTRRRMRRAVLLIAILTTLDVAVWLYERYVDPSLRVTFLSVGQGDAAVVELPRGGPVLVVDGGGFPGDFDPGERVIAPFLRARKILHVDVLALSHPQLDHYGGLTHLALQFRPHVIWWNGMTGTGGRFARLQEALGVAGTHPLILRRGNVLHLGPDVEVDVLHPPHVDGGSVNDASLVFRLRYGSTSVLFTGDIEHGAERALLGERELLRSNVLKVPHHGSATSSTAAWLAAVAPRIAVVSSGADNRFSFPSPEVVRRLRAVGATVWNTAEQGAVRVVSDGHVVQVASMRLPQHPSAAERFVFPQLLW